VCLSDKHVVPDTPLGTLDTHATTCQCLSDTPRRMARVYASLQRIALGIGGAQSQKGRATHAKNATDEGASLHSPSLCQMVGRHAGRHAGAHESMRVGWRRCGCLLSMFYKRARNQAEVISDLIAISLFHALSYREEILPKRS